VIYLPTIRAESASLFPGENHCASQLELANIY
jgi:hypothetical protein